MSLEEWERNRWIRTHESSAQEISSLLAIAERDISDAAVTDVSPDSRFGIAYNAALKLCTVLLCAEGYRASHQRTHDYTIRAMPLILGANRKADGEYLDTCRRKRHVAEYDYAGGVTEDEVEELLLFVRGFREDVVEWLQNRHPELA
jgi:uncharacterized protein (UPF0332 family)